MPADGLSDTLQVFVRGAPFVRQPILSYVRDLAASLPAGATVVDVGAGEAPYRELFAHCEYTTVDWENSVHPGASRSTVISPADDIALPDRCADAVLLTEVLEHVPEPSRVLAELYRILRPGGTALITVPFVWELHEVPYDYWRFTPSSLRRLMQDAGFIDNLVEARNDCFSTAAQVLRNLAIVMGRSGDATDVQRDAVIAECNAVSDEVAKLAPLDVEWILPLGWAVTARRPGGPPAHAEGASNGPGVSRPDAVVETDAALVELRRRTAVLRQLGAAQASPDELARADALEAQLAQYSARAHDLEARLAASEARVERIVRHPVTRIVKQVLRIPGARKLAGLYAKR
jgi:SAM-dependent methyltransferase